MKEIDENSEKLFRFFTEMYPFTSEDTVRNLMESHIRRKMEEGKSRTEAIKEILQQQEEIKLKEHLFSPRGVYGKEEPTAVWYLLPFLLGIIGGVIGYVCLHDEHEEMAKSLLLFGILISAMVFIVWFLLF